MPTSDDFDQIAYLIYDENRLYNGKASEFGLPEPYFMIWLSEEAFNTYYPGRKASIANFYEKNFTSGAGDRDEYPNALAICAE